MSLEATKHCEFCGAEFTPSRGHGWARFCSNACCNRSRNHASYEDYLKNNRQAKAERHRREIHEFGLTTEEKNSVLRGLHGTFEQHRAEAKTWNERQMKYAKKLYTERYLGGPTFVWGRY